MYHIMFVLLLVHFALVYLQPGYFYNPRGQWRSITGHRSGSGLPENKVIERGDRRLLYGGESEDSYFDITTFRLKPENLHYGLGREAFAALIKPEFESARSASQWLADTERVLAVKIGQQVRVYPVSLLTQHEVVNDEINGVPFFAAYCILADLGAVYDRRVADHVLTFGVSGYTYATPEVWDGSDAFVLWDRDTQSLWWPPLGKAVSGPLIDMPLKLLDEKLWMQSTWGTVRIAHPDAMVLKPGQDLERPKNWQALTIHRNDVPNESAQNNTIAPRWGENVTW